MKNKKFWKIILMSTSILSVTTTTALVSCGRKTPTQSWNSFKAKAMQETADKIVLAKPPKSWVGDNKITFSFISSPVIDEKDHTIARTIVSSKFNTQTIFKIDYKKGTTYNYKNWSYNVNPHLDQAWETFQTSATKETAKNIVAANLPDAWKSLDDFEISNSATVDHNGYTITVIIKSKSEIGKEATFSITYIKGSIYDAKNWKCIMQPKTDFIPTGFGKSKSAPYLYIEVIDNDTNPITPSMIYNDFGVHQVILMGANVYDFYGKKALGWNSHTPLLSRVSKEAIWIYKYEALGGHIGISFGGILGDLNNTSPWDTQTPTEMAAAFSDIAIKQYNMEDLDFDIEPGHNYDLAKMNLLVQAINKMTTSYTTLDVSLTISCAPTINGVPFWGSDIDFSKTGIPAFKKLNKTPIMNPMVFDFEKDIAPGDHDYIGLIKQTITETNTYFANIFNVDSKQFMKNNLSVTSMIGRSDHKKYSEVLTLDYAIKLAQYCKTNNILRMSFWNINRDFPGPYDPTTNINSGTDNLAGAYSKVNVKYFEN